MISKKNRFRGNREIEWIYKKGEFIRLGSFSAKFVKKKGDDYRLAVVVSKKIHKSAVVRNRIRRRVFEQIRKQIKENPPYANNDLVITIFDENVAAMDAAKLKNLVEKLLLATAKQ